MSNESSITQEEAKEFLERINKESKNKQSATDKDKVLSFIRSLTFKEAIPDVNDKELVDILDYIVDYVKGFKEGVEERINKIK